jgi:hypothetical protein
MSMHLRHTCTISWLEYTENNYNQQNNGLFLQNVFLTSPPRTRMNESNDRLKMEKNPQTTHKRGLYNYME